MSFGEWLRRQRSGRGLTQKQLAHQVGCATITLRKIESEERRPSAEIVERLAAIFEIPKNEQTNFLKFARGDWTKAPGESSGEKPWQEMKAAPRTNLPATITAFLGREKQLAEIRNYLLQAEIRLVTLIGPPGMGKTRLSIEAARQSISDFRDGVFFVGLASIADPNLIAGTVRQSLGYVENPKLTPDQHLMQAIEDKQILIVLDNCEHLVADAATFASRLLSACPNLKFLTTSREALHISGEWLYTVPPLDLPQEPLQDEASFSKYPALTLFEERTRAVRNDFAITNENIQIISAICAELEGLPLAIELVAAQMRLHSPQSLLQRLNDRFVLSVQGTQAVPSRQVTLSQAIGWSYDSLSPDEQRLFAYLSVFSGGFTLDAVETIFSDHFPETPVSDLVASLLDKSLLQSSTDSNGGLRFSMLVTIRHYAKERLTRLDELSEVRNRHLAYFVNLAEHANAETQGPEQVEWMDRLETEMDNFRSTLDWCISRQNAESALRLLNALNWTWNWRGYFSEKEKWFNKIRELPNAREYPAQYASLLNNIGDLLRNIDVDMARPVLEESREIWLKLEEDGERGLARVLSTLGTLALINEENIGKAKSYFDQSLKLHQKYEDEQETAWLIFRLGSVADAAGYHVEAEEKFMESLAKFKRLGNRLNAAYVLSGLGEMARHQGNYEQAEIFWGQNLELLRELRVPHAFAYPYLALASVSFHQGNYEKAKSLFKKSLKIFRGNYDRGGAVICFAGLAGILAINGEPEQAARLFGAAELILENIGALEPADQLDFDNYKRLVREQLNEVAFEKARAKGRSMTMEQAIQYALEELGD